MRVQKLWVVFTNFCLFFYKTFQVSEGGGEGVGQGVGGGEGAETLGRLHQLLPLLLQNLPGE